MTTSEILVNAKSAAPKLAVLDRETKDRAIEAMAASLLKASDTILEANSIDVEAARGTISDVMIDRLALNVGRIEDMAKGMREVADLPDPVWNTLERVERPGGLIIEKVSVPMGVIAIIYESRPNVTSDAAVLAFKSSSACVLRSGKEAWRSAKAIVNALQSGLASVGLPAK